MNTLEYCIYTSFILLLSLVLGLTAHLYLSAVDELQMIKMRLEKLETFTNTSMYMSP
jgi:hypothetical protein